MVESAPGGGEGLSSDFAVTRVLARLPASREDALTREASHGRGGEG
jgi:hypothetical protein